MNVSGGTLNPAQRLRNRVANALDDVWFGTPEVSFDVSKDDVIRVSRVGDQLVVTRGESVTKYDSRFVLTDALVKILPV